MTDSHTLRNLAFGSAGLLTLSLMTATVVERLAGSEAAFTAIYHSPWMIALWAVSAACSLAWLLARRRGMSVAAMGLHLSLLLILAGAGITYLWGKQGKVTLVCGEPPADGFTLDDGGHEPLPFSLSLDHSEIEYYPGTSSPMDYASVVVVNDGSAAPSRRRLSMNNILELRGYRFYQTSLAPDSSTLSVSYDPWGIGVTYAGYISLMLSMAGFFMSRKSRFRRLLRRCAPLLLLLLTETAAAAPAPPPQTIPRPLAARLGKVNVYWGDRVMPLQTMARDFCLKVNGSTSYRGLTAEQVVAGWLFYYDSWKNEPFIKVEGEEASRLLGLDGGGYASIKDFYTTRGYRLEHAVADDLADRKLRDTDSRVALVTMVCTGSAFRVFPVAVSHDGPVEWLSFADRPPADIDGEGYIFITTVLDRISREVAGRQWKNADDEISRLRDFQSSIPGVTLPSASRIEAELLYNRYGSPLWPGLVALMLAVAGLFPLCSRCRRVCFLLAVALFGWVSLLMGLRWYVGGHVPLSNGYETMLLMGWLSIGSAVGFFPARRFGPAAYAALAVGGLSLLVAMMGRGGATVSHLMPVLASPLLSIHVLLVMASYALLAVIAILSGVALGVGASTRKGASMARLCALLLYPGVFMLAAGIFVGAVWANQSWGRYWGWDPKETWALVTLLVYAFPLHGSSFPSFRRPRGLCLYLLLAFLSVLMTYFGVNHLLSGLHSYA